MSGHFTAQEFRCRCGRSACEARRDVTPALLDRLEIVRDLYGKPMRVTSALRCPAWNTLSGGVPGSEHLTGEAVDIACETAQDRYEMLTAGFRAFHRIGVGRTFLHFGCGEGHPPRVAWLYGP